MVKVKKVATNINLGPVLKEKAKAYARGLEMDLSELIGHLLREEIANPTLGKPKIYPLPEITALRVGEEPQKGNGGKS